MATRIGWANDVQAFFAAGQSWVAGRCHMVVERLPGRGWDRLVWASESRGRCLYGTAETAEEAKRAAEHALMQFQSPQLILPVGRDWPLYRQQRTSN